MAKSFAFYEIFDMIYIITGSYQRMAQFFKDNDDVLREEFGLVGNKDVKQSYQFKIVEYFYKNTGFELIDKILLLIKKTDHLIPFVFLYSLAHLFAGLSSVIQNKLK